MDYSPFSLAVQENPYPYYAYLLGAQVARLEAKVALEELLQQFPRLSRKDGSATRVESPILRGFKTLPLAVR